MPSTAKHRLFLLDGYAILYRAFYALISRPLRTTRGENTSAAWGVANFLLRLRAQHHPEFIVWVSDAGDSGRTERYPEYKSTREKLDEAMQADFDLALEHVRDLLTAFRVPVIEVTGYEADDVIGTMALQAAGQGVEAVIVSGDKDFCQLVRPGVVLLNPGRGGPAGVEEHWVDVSNASERLGVAPDRVVDYLALVGDSSDNVPGVKGIGDKGARKLLAEFGDLDSLLARASEVSSKRAREGLLAHAEEARLSRELVTIQCDVPVVLDLDQVKVRAADRDALVSVLTRLEFHSLINRVLDAEQPPTVPEVDQEVAPERVEASTGPSETSASKVHVVSTLDQVQRAVRHLRNAGAIALRSWVTGPEPRDWRLVGLAMAAEPSGVWYFPFAHEPPDGPLAGGDPPANLPPLTHEGLAPLRELLCDPDIPKHGHDLKAELEALRGAGVELSGLGVDVMLASFLTDPGRRTYALPTLILEHLGRQIPGRNELLGRGKTARLPEIVGMEEVVLLCAEELDAIHALHELLQPAFEGPELQALYREIECPLILVLSDMEWAGIAIDQALFLSLGQALARDLEALEIAIAAEAGVEFNLNSPKQMATVLFEKLQLPTVKRTKTGASTDAEVLEQLAAMGHEVPRLILEHRELQKLQSTYVDVLPRRVSQRTGRIHTSFNQTGAATGRLSSSDPNLQNIPIRTPRGEAIRRGFVPREGWSFVVADYSQIELRLLAHFSGDPAFVEAFTRGEDIHRQTAAIIFDVPSDQVTLEMRAQAKTINFATIYGQGAFALARQLGISQEEAKAFIADYFERFAGVRSWLDGQVELARTQGWVETLFHRRRFVPEIKDRNFNVRAFGERLAQNSPLQGSAADLIKVAMIRIHETLGRQGHTAQLLLQVHDELVLEAPPDEVDAVVTLVRRHLEGAANLRVPLVVDVGVGTNWLDAKG